MSDLKIQPMALPIEEKKPVGLKPGGAKIGALEKEKMRLKKATREFESFFMQSMLKSMRATIPKSDESDGAPGGGFGKDIFESMFDQELAKKMSERSHGGLGDMLYKKLLPRLEAYSAVGPSISAKAIQIGTKDATATPASGQSSESLKK